MKRTILALLALATAPAQAKDHSYRSGDSVYYDKDHWIIASADETIVDKRFVGDGVEFPDVRIVIIGNVTHIGRIAECSANAQAIEMSGAPVSVRGRVVAIRPRVNTVASTYSGSVGDRSYETSSRDVRTVQTLMLANCSYGTARHVPPSRP